MSFWIPFTLYIRTHYSQCRKVTHHQFHVGTTWTKDPKNNAGNELRKRQHGAWPESL